jgi:hypothetical protein
MAMRTARRWRDLALAFVEHLHIAAEGYGRYRVLGLVRACPVQPQGPSETDRETQHLDAEAFGDDEVAELVHRDQHADSDDEVDDGVQKVHA